MNDVPLSVHLSELKPKWKGDEGAEAIQTLAEFCVWHQGGGTIPIIEFLLGLYNGALWKPDMQLLCRRIDSEHFQLVLRAMVFIRRTDTETHMLFERGEELMDFLKGTVTRWVRDPADCEA